MDDLDESDELDELDESDSEAIVYAEDDEGSGPWSKHLLGDQTGNKEQGTGREQGTDRSRTKGTGRQAGRVVKGLA